MQSIAKALINPQRRPHTKLMLALSAMLLMSGAHATGINPVSKASPAPIVQLAHAGPHMHKRHGRHARRHLWRELMHELNLSDSQRDEIFKVRHEAAPMLRQHRMKVRAAKRELRGLSFSDQFNETRANELAEQMARARAEVARLRAQSNHKIFNVLNTEQRAMLIEKLKSMRRV